MAQSVEHILGKDEVTSSSLVSSSIKSHENIVGFLFPPNQPFIFQNCCVMFVVFDCKTFCVWLADLPIAFGCWGCYCVICRHFICHFRHDTCFLFYLMIYVSCFWMFDIPHFWPHISIFCRFWGFFEHASCYLLKFAPCKSHKRFSLFGNKKTSPI